MSRGSYIVRNDVLLSKYRLLTTSQHLRRRGENVHPELHRTRRGNPFPVHVCFKPDRLLVFELLRNIQTVNDAMRVPPIVNQLHYAKENEVRGDPAAACRIAAA